MLSCPAQRQGGQKKAGLGLGEGLGLGWTWEKRAAVAVLRSRGALLREEVRAEEESSPPEALAPEPSVVVVVVVVVEEGSTRLVCRMLPPCWRVATFCESVGQGQGRAVSRWALHPS